MPKEPTLTEADLAALAAVDGTPVGAQMPAAIKTSLAQLGLVERRAWPNGPLWRTPAGNKRLRDGR